MVASGWELFADGSKCQVSRWLGLGLYLEKHLREREDLEILHRSFQVTCSCLDYFCGLPGFCIRC